LKKCQASGKINDKKLNGQINQCLALLGCVPRIKRRGINILSLDGGGAKGLVTIEILKNIQKKCNNKPIHELFDYISGTSTGAVLACLLGIYKFSLDECESFYRLFAKEMFSQNTAVGLSNLLMQKSFYDTKCWENILKEVIDDRLLIESTRDTQTPRISIVSNVLSDKLLKIFLFRNYTSPLSTMSLSHFDGTHKHRVYDAVRATSAAPFYYDDYKIEGYMFNDGGLLANNPTSIAIHESKRLWPNCKIQSVTSIGNGRFYNTSDYTSLIAKCDSLTLKQKVSRIAAGVINTENVHTVLHDLLPPKVYFRFNPYMSEEFNLDENRDDKWEIMQHDTRMYMRRNDHKFNMAAKQLLLEKTPLQLAEDFIRSKF
jgi:calcium-independent phospholipase A2-gamma